MSIYIDSGTRVVVQGITGSEGGFHTRRMLEYGTNIVAGVTPGKGGASFEGVPVYNTVEDAVKHQRANAASESEIDRINEFEMWGPEGRPQFVR